MGRCTSLDIHGHQCTSNSEGADLTPSGFYCGKHVRLSICSWDIFLASQSNDGWKMSTLGIVKVYPVEVIASRKVFLRVNKARNSPGVLE